MSDLNETHDPARRSWVESANAPEIDFPIQNLPYGVFSTAATAPRVGVAIGDSILDLAAIEATELVRPDPASAVFDRPSVNAFMALGPKVWSETCAALSSLLSAGESTLRDDDALRSRWTRRPCIYLSFSAATPTSMPRVSTRRMSAPCSVARRMPCRRTGCTSPSATMDGLPRWSSPVRRPLGQLKGPNDLAPRFGPCEKLDIELELGAIVGTPSELGQSLITAEAVGMVFGYVLLNDWSARDIQVWEYQPLGRFQSKAFATSISPWIVTSEALAPFRASAPPPQRPLLPYLEEAEPGLYDIALEVSLAPGGREPTIISRTNCRYMYYSAAQQLTHHAVGGCAMRTGDLLGSGTISGPDRDACGSLLDITWNGSEPLAVDGGKRAFLEDGDTVVLRGFCEGDHRRIGFGTCEGQIMPSPALPAAWRA